ncbi:ADP-heptose:LPS heptosyltransferase [Motilibacter rhizosphaerae]|uniref:ADP-heptose:LPS heptosyltransferase n=1 Tax=Motilibacter rhizosphaerae TaxID=598652 RepID=A0A4Q7NW63_9ACTN|nr:glycosyltransferase family 9 protein [Motilibacter rhizosphaerae]RZS91533.1 ADP-heptose:LPS heptosyltransferase [Motilibacter rhizosphaerae]
MTEVLVVELLGGLGDVLLALPSVVALSRTHGSPVDVVTFTPGDALLRHDPTVGSVFATSDHSEGAPRRFLEEVLARKRYDVIVSTTAYDGIGELCAASAPVSATSLWRGAPDGHLVDRRFLALLADDGVIAPAYADEPLRLVLTPDEAAAGEAALGDVRRPAVLVPGSGMPVKEWGGARFAALAAGLAGAGYDVLTAGLEVPAELAGLPRLPPGDLRHLAAVLAAVGTRGGVVVGGDTGPVRIAAAVGCRVVGLFGPTSAGRYGFSAATASNLQGWPGCPVRLPSAITEQECWWTGRCPYAPEPACLADLAVERVLAAAVGD